MATKSTDHQHAIAVAKTADGTIQITFTVPADQIQAAKDEALKEMAHDAQVPGFRKGKAPAKLAAEHISEENLIQKALGKILPHLLSHAIQENNIRPAIYPKFELVSAEDGKDWQIRAVTCELPQVELGDYKKVLTGAARASAIWTPQKGQKPGKDDKKEPTQVEKEQEVIKILLETIKVTVPALLIEEEVNSRLANLLARIEKLGLSLEGYLASIGKTADALRTEYAQAARDALALDLILGQIAENEKIIVTDAQVEEALKSTPGVETATPEQKTQQASLIRSILRRRASLDSLTSLV